MLEADLGIGYVRTYSGGCPGGYPTSQKSLADYSDAIRFLVFNRLFSE
jgi:hypothetical protein